MADHSSSLSETDGVASVKWKEGLIIYGLFLALTLIMTWPIVAQLGQAVPGRDGDVYVRLWTHRWVRDSLLAGRSPFFTDMLFFPTGVSLATHNIAWFNIAAWLPLQLFMSEAAAYSIVYLNILALNGFAGYLLIFEYTRSRIPSFTGGFITAFWPLILSHNHHPNIIIIAWVILTMLFLKRTIEGSRLRDALLLGAFLALIGISRWQMLLIGGVLIAGFGLFLILQPDRLTKRNLLLIGLAGVVAGIVMLPFLLPGLREMLFTPTDSDVFLVGEGNSIDLQALFVPSRYHPLWGPQLIDVYVRNFGNSSPFTPFIGYTTLLLVAVGLILKWRDTRMWLLLALILLVLSFGDDLRFGGVPFLPLPYRFLKNIDIVRLIRHPLRFGIVLAIPVAIMASYGMLAIQQHRLFTERRFRFVTLLVLGLLSLEYVKTSPMMPLHVPAWFKELAKDQEEFGIVDIPMDSRSNNENYMFYQLTHGKPIAGGKIARVPTEANEFIRKIPMLGWSPEDGMPDSDILTVAGQFSLLNENNIRYLVLHKNLLGESLADEWESRVNIPPIYQDDELIVYDSRIQEPVASHILDTGTRKIGVVDYKIETPQVDQAYPIGLSIRWFLPQPVDAEVEACFYALGADGTGHELDCFPVSEETPTFDLPVRVLLESGFSVLMDPRLDSGQYSIQVSFIDQFSDHNSSRGTLALGEVTLSALPRQVANEAEESPVAIWDDTISLNTYDVTVGSPSETQVSLRLQALENMTSSYKMFLHLVREDTDELVSQVDAIPLQWSYPTTWWQQYEIVEDSIDFAHGDVDAGHYQLWFGLYDELSLDRLAVSKANDVPLSETMDAILLYEFDR